MLSRAKNVMFRALVEGCASRPKTCTYNVVIDAYKLRVNNSGRKNGSIKNDKAVWSVTSGQRQDARNIVALWTWSPVNSDNASRINDPALRYHWTPLDHRVMLWSQHCSTECDVMGYSFSD